MERNLRRKLEEALTEVAEQTIDGGIDSLDDPEAVRNSVETQARQLAIKLHEYFEQFIFDKIETLESKVDRLENRIDDLEEEVETLGTTTTP